jgi:hypothetical protein
MGRWSVLAALGWVVGCAAGEPPTEPGETARLSIQVDAAGFTGVASVRIKVRDLPHDCGDPGFREAILPVGAGAQALHAFFVVPPGIYTVCLDGLDGAGGVVGACQGGVGPIVVVAGSTAEVTTFLSCREERGGIAVSVGLNHSPAIDSVEILPGSSLTACDTAHISVSGGDVDGDPVFFTWVVSRNAGGGRVVAEVDDSRASFHASTPGEYEVSVSAEDNKRGFSALALPFHVSPAPCP